MDKIRVGIVGLGGMGRMHFGCYGKNPDAEVVAICDVDENKRSGNWGELGLNIGTSGATTIDMSKIKTYADWNELAADPDIDVIDVCLPIHLHAPAAIAALKAGKDVFCEKPMARTSDGCVEMEAAATESGKQLMIGHCLRYWPEYVATHAEIASGAWGKPLYARFHRAGGTPTWSHEDWLRDAKRSGGVILDMHVHDVDAALWWFGKPTNIDADGIFRRNSLPVTVDATWQYADGLRVNLHSAWDDCDPPFRYAFTVVMERGTITFDSSAKEPALRLHTGPGEVAVLPTVPGSAYQNEIDDFIAHLRAGTPVDRVTPAQSRDAVEAVEEETRQVYAKNGRTM